MCRRPAPCRTSTGPSSARCSSVSVWWRWLEMRDAEIGDVEDEDRVAGVLGAAAAIVADIGRHVVDVDVAEGDVVVRHAARRIPAAQDQLDPGIGKIGVMRRVGVVHRHDVGNEVRPDVAVIVGDDADAAWALDEEAGMAEKADADMARRAPCGGPRPRPAGRAAALPPPPCTTRRRPRRRRARVQNSASDGNGVAPQRRAGKQADHHASR